MISKTTVLLTGVTGYIGGSVLTRLIDHPEFLSYEVTTILRSSEKAEKLKKLGIAAVVGSHDDEALMESLAAKADIVIATADADNFQAAKATLSGLKKRYAETGRVPIYIHTVIWYCCIADNAAGHRTTETIYDDASTESIESVADTALHRNVDMLVVNADKEGYVKTYIVLPSSVYGTPSNVLVDQGIQNPHSVLVPYLTGAAISRGQVGIVGVGKNTWDSVHIDDTVDLYVVLLKSIKDNRPIGHGREGFYVAENGVHSLYEVGQAIGKALVALGKIDNAEPTPFTADELVKYFGAFGPIFGVNVRALGNRSRAIGWKPRYTKEDMFASVKGDIEAMYESGRLQ